MTIVAGQKVRTSDLTTGLSVGLGRIGSVSNTAIATNVTAEVLLGSVTFTAIAGRRYRIDVSGSVNGPTGSAVGFRIRWAVGGSVTTSGTDIYEVQGLPVTNLSETIAGFCEAPNIFTAGSVTVGLFAVQLASGGGTTKYGNGTLQPSNMLITDIGT